MFRTLREQKYEKLAQVKPEVWIPKNREGDLGSLRADQEGCLIVRYPYVPTGALAPLDRWMMNKGLIPRENWFQLPLIPRKGHRYPMQHLTIWKNHPQWINLGEYLPHGFKQWLGVENPITIFRADPD